MHLNIANVFCNKNRFGICTLKPKPQIHDLMNLQDEDFHNLIY